MATAFNPYVQAIQYAQQSLAATSQQSAPAKDKEQISPSLAAVQAHVHYQNKEREKLLESRSRVSHDRHANRAPFGASLARCACLSCAHLPCADSPYLRVLTIRYNAWTRNDRHKSTIVPSALHIYIKPILIAVLAAQIVSCGTHFVPGRMFDGSCLTMGNPAAALFNCFAAEFICVQEHMPQYWWSVQSFTHVEGQR
eukprot:1190757-Pleurochrysis_carterae.AAC.2